MCAAAPLFWVLLALSIHKDGINEEGGADSLAANEQE